MQAAVLKNGREALEQVGPQAAEALVRLERAAWGALADTGLARAGELMAAVVAAQHGLEPLGPFEEPPAGVDRAFDAAAWRSLPGLDEPTRTALAFAEQMAFDVSSIQDEERQALFASLGPEAVTFVQAVYVADLLPRARAALDATFGASPSWAPAEADLETEDGDLQSAFDELIRVVPQLQALDPVSTELARLLGARRHRCRICQSLRNRTALVAGADEQLYDAIDRHAESDLSESQRALLAFVDAMLLSPARVDTDTAARLAAAYSQEACVELVLDVVRNAANKVAVALAADAPNVEEGLEIYDVGPDGELLYGLEAP